MLADLMEDFANAKPISRTVASREMRRDSTPPMPMGALLALERPELASVCLFDPI
jgi:hypothetical protein